MTGSVESNYSLALFQLAENDAPLLTAVRDELVQIKGIIKENPDFVKLMDTPTVGLEQKMDVLKAFDKAQPCVYNFLRVLAENGRYSYYEKITDAFYSDTIPVYFGSNDKLGIGEITVTSALPLSEKQLADIKAKMGEITGKTIVITQKTDKSIMGGVVIDYGDQRFDGSVKTRLEALKQSFGQLIG